MKPKKYLAETSKGLIHEFNEFLKEKGISNLEMPFIITKLQFALDEDRSYNFTESNNEKVCIEWDSKLVERTNPKTGKKYWQLVERCVRYEEE